MMFLLQWHLEKKIFFQHLNNSLSLLSSHDIIQEDQAQTVPSNPNPDGPAISTSAQQTVPGTNVQAEKIVPNKTLLDWLRQQSDYTLEIPGFGTVSTVLASQHCVLQLRNTSQHCVLQLRNKLHP